MSHEERNQVLELASNESGPKLSVTTGATQAHFASRYPLFCPQCMKDAVISEGEPYFLTFHQAPGVKVCTYHGLKLLEYRSDRGDMYVPRAEKLPSMYKIIQEFNPEINTFAKNVTVLFKKQVSFEPEELLKVYKLLLGKKFNFGKGQHLIDLVYSIQSSFSQKFLLDTGCAFSSTSNWVLSFFRKKKKIFTWQHLLLIQFLYGSLDDFLTEYTRLSELAKKEIEPEIEKDKITEKTAALREIVAALCETFSTREQIRTQCPDVYYILLQCDRGWMEKNLPRRNVSLKSYHIA